MAREINEPPIPNTAHMSKRPPLLWLSMPSTGISMLSATPRTIRMAKLVARNKITRFMNKHSSAVE
jgi:hypothetical protein